MKARVQSLKQLKEIATRELEAEFKSNYQKATLDGAMQGIAFVMYTLELCQGWREKRQKKLFEDMLSVLDLPEGAPWMEAYNGKTLLEKIETTYGLDFNQLLERSDALTPLDE